MLKKNLFNTFLSLLYFPFAGLLLYLSYHSPQFGVLSGSLGGVSLLLLLALIVFPVGRMRFGEITQSLGGWFFKVACVELIFVIVFLGGVTAFFGGGPLFAQNAIEIEALRAAANDYSWLLWGFMPWSLLIIWVVLLGYYYYVRKVGPYPHQVGCDVFPNLMPDRAKSFTETTIHSTNTLAIAILANIVLLLVIYSIQLQFDLVPHGLLVPIGFTILGFFSFFAVFYFRKKKLRQYDKKGLHLGFCINFSLIIIFAALLSTSYLVEFFIKTVKPNPDQLLCDSCMGYFQTTLPSNRMAAYFWGWGMVFLPLFTSIFVRLSKGRSIREIVIGLTLLPGILYIALSFNFEYAIQILSNIGFFDKTSTQTYKICMMLTMAVVCYGLLMAVVFNKNNSHVLHAGVLDNLERCKSGRMRIEDGAKLVGLPKLFLPVYLAIVTFIIMHMVGGWFLIQINIEIFAIICMFHSYGAMVIMFLHFKQQGLWRHPERAKPYGSKT